MSKVYVDVRGRFVNGIFGGHIFTGDVATFQKLRDQDILEVKGAEVETKIAPLVGIHPVSGTYADLVKAAAEIVRSLGAREVLTPNQYFAEHLQRELGDAYKVLLFARELDPHTGRRAYPASFQRFRLAQGRVFSHRNWRKPANQVQLPKVSVA